MGVGGPVDPRVGAVQVFSRWCSLACGPRCPVPTPYPPDQAGKPHQSRGQEEETLGSFLPRPQITEAPSAKVSNCLYRGHRKQTKQKQSLPLSGLWLSLGAGGKLECISSGLPVFSYFSTG